MKSTPIFADTPEAACLGMLVSASSQEIAAGWEGWVKAPKQIISHLEGLERQGLAERKLDEPFKGWWRATKTALSQTIYATSSGTA